MDDRPESEAAAVFDFVCLFLEDADRGESRSLSEYLRRFPDHQDAVASEYLKLVAAEDDEPEPIDLGEGPQSVGPYRLIRELGAGGQGAVYLAEDTRIDRQVALKILHGGFVTAERRARLKREAESIAGLAHPGICAVLEAEVEGDPPYIAMPLLEGVDLGTALTMAREGRGLAEPGLLPGSRAELVSVLHYFERVARALHAAHEAGVVHRDVKPGNLFVGESGRPVVLDFGLARDDERADDGLTQSGQVFGTPAYMSPEQLSGRQGAIDARTDIFSLGVTLYESLIGERPFQADSPFALQRAILMEPPPDPRARNGQLTEDVKVVLETALEKDAERRYPTALAFAEDLRRIRVYEPVLARPAGPGLRLRRWVRREPALATAIGGVFLLLAVSLSIALTLLADTRDALRLATGNLLTARVAEVNQESSAAALALGLEVLRMAPGPRARSALYGPLEESRLVHVLEVANDGGPVQTYGMALAGQHAWISFNDGCLRSFDMDSGELVDVLAVASVPGVEEPEARAAYATQPVAVDPAGEVVVCGTWEGRVIAHDAAGGLGPEPRPLWSLELEGGPLSWVEFSPDGSWLVAQTLHGRTHRIDPRSGALVRSFGDPEAGHVLARVSPDGSRVATSTGFLPPRVQPDRVSDVRLWDAASGELLHVLQPSDSAPGPVSWLAFGPDVLATSAHHGEVHLYDADDGASRGVIRVEGAELTHLDVDPAGERVAFCSRIGVGQAWVAELAEGTPRPLEGHGGPVYACSFSPDGERVATCGFDRSIRIWDARSAQLEASLEAYMNPLRAHWSPSGDRVTAQALLHQAFVFETRTSPYAYRLEDVAPGAAWATFTPDGHHAVVGGRDGVVGLHATPAGPVGPDGPAPGELVRRFEGLEGAVTGGRVDGQGRSVLAWSRDGGLRMWGLVNGEPRLTRARPGVIAADLSPDGERCASVTSDGVARLHLAGGEDVELLAAGAGHVRYLEAGGEILVTHDGRWLSLFDGHTGAPVRAIELLQIPRDDPPTILGLDLWPGTRRACVVTQDNDVPLRTFLRTVDLDTGAQPGVPVFDPEDEASVTAAIERVTLPRSIAARWVRAFGDGHAAVAGGGGGGLFARVHTAGIDEIVNPEMGAGEALSSIDVDPAGRYVVTATEGGRAIVWDAADGSTFTLYDRHGPRAVMARFDPAAEAARVLSVCADGSAAVWPIDPLPAARARKGRELYSWERIQYLAED